MKYSKISKASGVEVCDDCVTIFRDFKLRNKYKWVMFRVSDDLSEIIIDSVEEEDMSEKDKKNMPADEAMRRFESFREALTSSDKAKYCIVDLNFWVEEPNGARPVTKIAFISWCPDSLKVRQRMLFASSKDALTKKLQGGFKEVQCSCPEELDYGELYQKLK